MEKYRHTVSIKFFHPACVEGFPFDDHVGTKMLELEFGFVAFFDANPRTNLEVVPRHLSVVVSFAVA